VLRTDHAGPGPFEMAGQVGHRSVGQATSRAGQGGQQPPLSFQQNRGRLATVGPPSVQLRRRQGVERTRRHLFTKAELAEAVLEFARGLAGESDGDAVGRIARTTLGPISDPAGEYPGLARTGRGEYAKRLRLTDDGRPLRRAETDEDVFSGWVLLHPCDDTDGV
jgi:hypothetical protein